MIEDAISHFKLAIKNDPNYLEAFNNLGMTYIQIGEAKKAIQIYASAVTKGAHFTDLHNNYGLSLLVAGNFKDAMAAIQRALKINKRSYVK